MYITITMQECTEKEEITLMLTDKNPKTTTIENRAWKENLIKFSAILENWVIDMQLPIFDARIQESRMARENQNKSVGAIVRMITDTIKIPKKTT